MVEPPGRAHPLTRRHPGKAAGLNSVIQVEVLPHTRVSPIDVTTHREEPVIAKRGAGEGRNRRPERSRSAHRNRARHRPSYRGRGRGRPRSSDDSSVFIRYSSAAVEAFDGRFALARRTCRLLGDSPEAHTRSGHARHAGILALPPPDRAGSDIAET
jgi:hypothetical protein